MANRKISDLTALTAPVTGDLLPIVDISEAAAADKNKKITYGTFLSSVPLGTAAAPSIAFTGDPNTGIYSPGADKLAFSIGGVEAARIDSSGRLLVGITTSAQYAPISIASRKSSGSNMLFLGSDSLADDELVRFYVQHGAGVGNHSSEIGIVKHSGIADVCSYLQLGGVTSGDRYFWVDNSGDYRLSSTFAHIGTTSGTAVGTQTSDERIKNILGPVEYGLNTINQIEPVRYTLKTAPNTERLGFVAQQVQSLVPQSVFDTSEHIEGEPEDAPTKLGMEYVALIPVLVNAIKELSDRNDALEARLAALEAQ